MSDTDDDILREVQDNFKAAADYEGAWRQRAADDERFLYADAYNGDQWEQSEWQARGVDDRPRLTINKTFQHFCQVNNDARQNKMGVKIVATGFGATAKAAEVLEGIVRHIEYQSNAEQNAYATAISHQVSVGRGWVHLVAEYIPGVDSFDQDLFIRNVPDWRSVYLDPSCQEADKSDARWGMVITTMDRAEFERDYPADKDVDAAPLDTMDRDRGSENEWETKTSVRVARYYRRSEDKDTLWNAPPLPGLGFAGGAMRESQMPDGMADIAHEQKWPSREVFDHRVEWFLIAGNRVIDSGDTVFKAIPLVPFVGVESRVDDRVDWRGLVRAMIDPQRMTNYAASKSVEGLAAGTTTGWVAPDDRIEGREAEWSRANIDPPAVLLYNAMSSTGEPLGSSPPEPVPPPQFSPGHMQLLTVSDQWMQMVTGQYQAEMGAPGNERSGRAINERQRQADTANYHYIDNQGMALRSVGRLVVDAIPKIYDVTRAVHVMGMDGTQQQAIVDPNQDQAHAVHTAQGPAQPGADPDEAMTQQGAILAVNPGVGRYDVQSDVGPSWGTQRQETFNALMQAVQAAPEMMGKVGDLLFKSADFPLADEISDRLAPPDGNPALAQAQQQIQALQAHVGQLTQQLKDKQTDQQIRIGQQQHDKVDDVMRSDIDRYKAETDRIAAIGSIDPTMLLPLVQQVVAEAMRTQIGGAPPPPPPPSAAPAMATPPTGPTPLAGGAAAPISTPQGTDIARLPTTNPPGGPIRSPVPSNGAVQ